MDGCGEKVVGVRQVGRGVERRLMGGADGLVRRWQAIDDRGIGERRQVGRLV